MNSRSLPSLRAATAAGPAAVAAALASMALAAGPVMSAAADTPGQPSAACQRAVVDLAVAQSVLAQRKHAYRRRRSAANARRVAAATAAVERAKRERTRVCRPDTYGLS